jgi:GNAT superfamily N-acetyltransferase
MKERNSSLGLAHIHTLNQREPAILTIRRADISDLPALTDLFDGYRQFYEQSSDLAGARSFLTERLTQQDSVIFVAEDASVLQGFTQLYPSFSSTRMARIFILNDLFVSPRARKKGAAAALLSAAADYAEGKGAIRLTLSTAHGNAAAQSLYQREGWVGDEHFQTFNLNLPRH